MSFSELIGEVRSLPRGETVQLMEFLNDDVGELASEESLILKSVFNPEELSMSGFRKRIPKLLPQL
ncbi:MAG TPA: hypothetical protein VGL71_02760 [Urbifossiella sp.]|jgi:hypothetical protein